jgi:hypothetical protein
MIHQSESCTLSILCGIDPERPKPDGNWREALKQLKQLKQMKGSIEIQVGCLLRSGLHNRLRASKTLCSRVIGAWSSRMPMFHPQDL